MFQVFFRAFGYRRPQDYQTVPLPDALEWLGLPTLPAAGYDDVIPVGVDPHNYGYHLHVRVDLKNNVSMHISKSGSNGTSYTFDGEIVYGGDAPLQLRLTSLFIRGTRVNAPNLRDTREFFESIRTGIRDNKGVGTLANRPCLESERHRYAHSTGPSRPAAVPG
jgi:hypothetical protein